MTKNYVKIGLFSLFLIAAVAHFFIREPELFPWLRGLSAIPAAALLTISALRLSRTYGWGNPHGRAFLILSGGALSILSANITQTIALLHLLPISTTLADPLYLLGYGLVFPGLLLELVTHGFRLRWNRKFFGWILLFFIMAAAAFSFQTTDNVIDIIYLSLDFGLVALIVLILRLIREYKGGTLVFGWSALLASVACFLLGDIFYSDKVLQGIWPHTIVNLFWLTGYLLATYGLFAINAAIQQVQMKLKK